MEQKIFMLLACINVIHGQDPCTSHQQLNDATRSVNHTLGSSETEQCDRLITENWYRFLGDGNIPTKCPPVLQCGSTGPIWINGSFPVLNNEVMMTVCQAGFLGCCEFTWQIRVRHCGSFTVFRLTPTPACPGRYCIDGPPGTCQPGWGSETGFEPCKPINITFVVTPSVQPYIPTYAPTSQYNQLAFECKANMQSSYQSFVFDIRWTIDNTVVAVKSQIAYSSLKTNGTLQRIDWDQHRNKKIGMRVACAMRARAFIGAPPTEYITSKEFFAGATVQATTINVQSGQSAVINIKSTVPIACRTILGSTRCNFRMELFSFADQFQPNEQRHCNKSLANQIKPSACGLEFDGLKWNQYQQVSVSALADQTSRPSYRALVKLRAISGGDTLWANYFLPDITVNVFSIRRPTGYCSSATDPTIRTVDGQRFTSLATGEFVLYKLRNKPIEVHTIQGKRGINCAVAVRAASEVFIVYGCGNTNKWIVRRINCNEQSEYLKIFDRSYGRYFQIFLPSGTQVSISIRRNSWLNVYVHPSFTDWAQTEGLCGLYNGIRNDDFTDRNGNIVGTTNFIRSWGVQQSESLFIAKIRNEILKTPFFYCSCNANVSNGDISETADCSWEESLPSCKPFNWGEKKCLIRGKRETEDDLEIDVPEELITFEESTLSIDWKNGWNETIARQRCESTLQRSHIYNECSSLQNVENENTVAACIMDIRVSGSDLFLSDVTDRMKSECISELRYNASLWNNDTETSEPSLIDVVYDNDCPNDCSSAGNCTKGKCVCQPLYTGDDCSVNTDVPPVLYDMSEESLCDLSKRPCTSTSVFGEGFYASANIKCKLQQAMLTGSTITSGNTSIIETGNLETFGEVKCPITGIQNRRTKATTDGSDPDVILVSVSMDGFTFSSSVPAVMFNSSCSSCVISGNSVTCDIRGDICIKDGECFDITHVNCATSNISPVKQPDAPKSLIIGIVVGSVCVLAILIMVIIKIYNHKRHCVKNVDEPSFSMGVTTVNGSAPVSHIATYQ